MASGQDSPTPDWKKIKEEAEAEKAALDAQKALLEARKALDAAQTPTDPDKKKLEDQVAAAKAAKDLADAAKAAADARKAEADASLAALKAQIGEVPASGIAGDTTLREKVGVAEAALLASKAVEEAADKMIKHLLAADTVNAVSPGTKTIILYPATDVPGFQALITYRAQIAIIEKAFAEAQAKSSDADTKAPKPANFKTEAVPIAAAGLALDAVTKLLGYFKSDYAVGGVDVTQNDSVLVHALAGGLTKSDKKFSVLLPGIYNPEVLTNSASGILTKLSTLSTLKIFSLQKVDVHDQLASQFTKAAETETDAAKKKDLLEKAQLHTTASAALKAASGIYDSFFGKLTTADDKGLVPLTQVIRDTSVSDALENGAYLLLVKLQSSGGSYYTRKNLWTFFGGMPIFHMGGVVTSFLLLDGKSGKVLASGVIPVHGGFVKAGQVRSHLQGSTPSQ